MVCPHCQEEIEDGSSFCSLCGKQLLSESPVQDSGAAAQSTKGRVLAFDWKTASGVISGDDGYRYDFQTNDWVSEARPDVGTEVDFEKVGSYAKKIYVSLSVGPASKFQPDESKGLAAGILDILFGVLGIHKFYLGYSQAGIIMLVVSIAGAIIILSTLIVALLIDGNILLGAIIFMGSVMWTFVSLARKKSARRPAITIGIAFALMLIANGADRGMSAMETIGNILSSVGGVLFICGVIWIIVSWIQKRPLKRPLIGVGIAMLVMVFGNFVLLGARGDVASIYGGKSGLPAEVAFNIGATRSCATLQQMWDRGYLNKNLRYNSGDQSMGDYYKEYQKLTKAQMDKVGCSLK